MTSTFTFSKLGGILFFSYALDESMSFMALLTSSPDTNWKEKLFGICPLYLMHTILGWSLKFLMIFKIRSVDKLFENIINRYETIWKSVDQCTGEWKWETNQLKCHYCK